MCSTCRKTFDENGAKGEEKNAESIEDTGFEGDFNSKLASRLIEKDKINESLEGIDVSPIKLQSDSSGSKHCYAKTKLKEAKSQMKKKKCLKN